MRAGRMLVLAAAAACTLGWLDPSAAPREAARLYDAGQFEEAAAKYNQALVDEPDSDLLHFNLGAAEYRRGEFEAAARAYGALPEDPAALYNQGNALYRLGLAAEEKAPQEALGKWAEALAAYRRAIARDPADEDAKFNYEWVRRKIDELQKKLEEQQQQQEQQQQEEQQEQGQEQGQHQQDQPQPEQQDGEAGQREQQDRPEDTDQPETGEPQAQEPGPEQAPPGGGESQQADARTTDGQLTREEATALLDAERNEELRPDEVIRRQLGSGDVPLQDW
ncbi:MAG TPA: tetratricopeptide repeat protein [Candidatus Limnocylindria bacterium]|nr:tetratricopeptide repeat protein [Candidatus Limnocylindria bacterium]